MMGFYGITHDGKQSKHSPYDFKLGMCDFLNQVFRIKPADGSLCYSLRSAQILPHPRCVSHWASV